MHIKTILCCVVLHRPTGEVCPGAAPDQRRLRHRCLGPDVPAPAVPPGLVPLRTLPPPGAARCGISISTVSVSTASLHRQGHVLPIDSIASAQSHIGNNI